VKIARFVADDLPSAVAAVRRAMGRDAVILSTRGVPRPGWRRWLRRFDRVEVVAAVEDAAVPRPAAAPAGLDVREPDSASGLRQALYGEEAAPPGMGVPRPIHIRPGSRRLVALVGPTGAGKTTTLAKLAAHLHLEQGWRVALITADTFRVGAAEQLQAYARLLGLPLEVTPTPGSLQRALERLAAVEAVLIDTSGRAHRDDRRMGELRAYLAAAREAGAGEMEAHLVLAAATRRAEAEAIVAAYRSLVDRLLLTKLDECEEVPDALAVAAAADLPLSYCCAGQRVPEDLALAWPDQIVAGLRVARPAGGAALARRR
jgi:flagellar biosynthesis GTPase FlhF